MIKIVGRNGAEKVFFLITLVCIAEKSFEMIVIYSDNSTMSNLAVEYGS